MSGHRPHDRAALLAALACVGIGLAVVALALFALPRSKPAVAARPPASGFEARSPDRPPKATKPRARTSSATVDPRSRREAWEQLFVNNEASHVPERWVQAFYPLYAKAQWIFGVNWLLLASIHRQETAFSTAGTTYQGLNFAGCCAGPMQFNVKNGPVSTWKRFRNAYRLARERPRDYPNETERHPSVYDDFDAMMAAGSLLKYSGAGAALDVAAWNAAYDYYGHDAVGIEYADQVLARAIGWSQTGFAINQGLDPELVAAVHAAWGEPVARALERAERKARRRADKDARTGA